VDRHMNIAPEALENLDQPLKVLVLQHTFGVPCRLDACMAWARKHSVPVVEDCCHTLDAEWDGAKVGSFGVGAIFAFEWGKPFSAGQGGLVTFQDEELARETDKIIALEAVSPSKKAVLALSLQRRIYRWLVTPRTKRFMRAGYRWAARRGIISGSEPAAPELHGHAEGFLKRMSRSQAGAALRELRNWPENLAVRREAADAIKTKLAAEGVEYEKPHAQATPMYLRFPVRVRSKPEILAAAESACLDIAGWYASPAHPLQGEALTALGYDPKTCPRAEEAFASVVTLPTRPALSASRLGSAVALIRDRGLQQ